MSVYFLIKKNYTNTSNTGGGGSKEISSYKIKNVGKRVKDIFLGSEISWRKEIRRPPPKKQTHPKTKQVLLKT